MAASRSYIENVDWNIVNSIGGDRLVSDLKHLGVSTVLNRQKFFEIRGYEPDIDTIWMVGGVNAGGSYDLYSEPENNFYIFVNNGNLAGILEGESAEYERRKWGYKWQPQPFDLDLSRLI